MSTIDLMTKTIIIILVYQNQKNLTIQTNENEHHVEDTPHHNHIDVNDIGLLKLESLNDPIKCE